MATDPKEIKVEDPEDYSTSTRLQQIYDARRELREMRRQASQYRHSGVSNDGKMRAVQYYRSAVESYLLEVDTLLRQHDPGPKLWSEKHYGTVRINPPGDFQEKRGYYQAANLKRNGNLPLKVTTVPDAKEVDIVGLKWLFEAQSPIEAAFEYDVHSHTYGETYTAGAKACVSWTTLNQMVSDVNSFLGDLGIGLDIDETQEWDI